MWISFASKNAFPFVECLLVDADLEYSQEHTFEIWRGGSLDHPDTLKQSFRIS